MEVAKRDALFLAMNMLGFMIALPPAYILMSKFFKVDYFIFLVTNLEERTITPYFIPKKLFNEGKWVIEGVRSGFRCKYGTFKDSEIDRILKEISKIDEEIGKLGREKEAILKDLISTPKRFKRFRLRKFAVSERLKDIEREIRHLKAEKNAILQELAWMGEDGLTVFVADKIDKKERKVILSPLHACSDLELKLDAKKFYELKQYVREIVEKYAKLKIDYEDRIFEMAAELILSFEKAEDEAVEELKEIAEEIEGVEEDGRKPKPQI